MAVTSDHIYYPNGGDTPAYDLRKIITWSVNAAEDYVDAVFNTGESGTIRVRFSGVAAFEAQKQLSLNAGG